jgi:hypothetical protein
LLEAYPCRGPAAGAVQTAHHGSVAVPSDELDALPGQTLAVVGVGGCRSNAAAVAGDFDLRDVRWDEP